MSLLRTAAGDEATVLIGYLDNHGTRVERVVRPMRVEGGQLVAHDDRDDEVRQFAVHRISVARLV